MKTRAQLPTQRRRISILCAAVFAVVPSIPASTAEPVLVDGFEAGTLLWSATSAEGPAAINRLALDSGAARRGQAGVLVEATTGDAGFINLDYDVGRAPVISELSASVWVRGDRPGVQLTARVVLPRSIDPKDGLPVSFLAYGESYQAVGRWQRLTIGEFVQKTFRRARKLRLEFGPMVDERGAYVDRVVLRIRPGRGRSKYAVDDLSVVGHLEVRPSDEPDEAVAPAGAGIHQVPHQHALQSPAHRDSSVIPSEFKTTDNSTASASQPPRVAIKGSTLLVDGRPFFPRIIEHAGESFVALRKLGFNTVAIPKVAEAEQLASAREAGLWVICSPPSIDQIEDGALGGGWDVVLAWHLGTSLTSRELSLIERQSAVLRRNDPWRGRPIVGHVEDSRRAFRRALDVLLVDVPIQPCQPAAARLESLVQMRREATPGTPFWMIVPTRPPLQLTEQTRLLTARAGETLRPFGLDDGEIERSAFLGVATGSRGLFFASSEGGGSANQRNLELELINQTLAPLDQLIAESQTTPSRIGFGAVSTYSLLRSNNGQVLLRFSDNAHVARHAGRVHRSRGAEGAARDGGDQGLTFAALARTRGRFLDGGTSATVMLIPGIPETSDVFRWTPAGMEPLSHRRVAGGVRVDLGESRRNDVLLLMRDRKLIAALGKQAAASSQRALQLAGELATLQIATLRGARGTSMPVSNGEEKPQFADAAAQTIATAAAMARRGDHARAYATTMGVREQLGAAMHSNNGSRGGLANAAPWSGYRAAPRLDALMQRLVGSASYTRTLSSGPFDELAESHRAGWRHFQSPADRFVAKVEITHLAPRHGSGCLHMAVKSPDGKVLGDRPVPDGLPATVSPLWITSPAVPITSGGLLHVHGWVRVDTRNGGGRLEIFDSIGGQPLSVRIGTTSGWQRFDLYRIAPRTEMLQVVFAIRGCADAWLDDIRIEQLVPPPASNANADAPARIAAPPRTQ